MTSLDFHALHRTGTPFLLPNAWDAASAMAFVDAGFPAVGTTSFGVASSLGRSDGDRTTKDANLALARALSVLPVPVSLDIEDGYHDDPQAVADYVGALDVAGINIEDSTAERLVPPGLHAAKVAAIKSRAPGLFVNARVDTYWLGQEAELEPTLARAKSYVEAGADGVFVPGATDPEVLRELAVRIGVPLNTLLVPQLSLAELGELGVRRVSTGSAPYRAALDAAVGVATAARAGDPVPAATSYGEMQGRLLRLEALAHRP
jgi:2-methylisocitrate lyase-like PEP mutase family enzyme